MQACTRVAEGRHVRLEVPIGAAVDSSSVSQCDGISVLRQPHFEQPTTRGPTPSAPRQPKLAHHDEGAVDVEAVFGDREENDILPSAWLARVLFAERQVVMASMEARHKNLLRRFDAVMSGHTHRLLHGKGLANLHGISSTAAAPIAQPRAEGNIVVGTDIVVVRAAGDGPEGQIDVATPSEPVSPRPSLIRSRVHRLADDITTRSSFNLASSTFVKFDSEAMHQKLRDIVTSPAFEMFFGLLIVCNTICMALNRQYEGLESAYILGYKNTTTMAQDKLPGVKYALDNAEIAFGSLFILEVVVKLAALSWRFVVSAWNVFDAAVVALWIADVFGQDIVMSPMLLRLARIARVVRVLRVARWLQLFDPLQLIVKSIIASISVVFWAVVVITLLVVAIAILTGQIVEPFIRDDTEPMDARLAIFESWGTFTRCMVSISEISLANWAPQIRLLMENVSETLALTFLAYRCSAGFCVVQVITAVFIQRTFKIALRDEEIMISEKRANCAATLHHLDSLFKCLDTSGDGLITREEFEAVVEDCRVRTWFKALEVEVSDMSELFDMLDDGDGVISREEFVGGIHAIKGSAKASDMFVILKRTRNVCKHLHLLDAQVKMIRDALSPPEFMPAEIDGSIIEMSKMTARFT